MSMYMMEREKEGEKKRERGVDEPRLLARLHSLRLHALSFQFGFREKLCIYNMIYIYIYMYIYRYIYVYVCLYA